MELMFIVQLGLSCKENGMKALFLMGNGYFRMVISMRGSLSIISRLGRGFGNLVMGILWLVVISRLLFHRVLIQQE